MSQIVNIDSVHMFVDLVSVLCFTLNTLYVSFIHHKSF